MDTKIINRQSIKTYLADNNIHPAIDKGYYGMYHSPFRADTHPSFKVDYNKNLWIDFGTNQGGTFIDLVMRLQNCSFLEAVNSLNQNINRSSFTEKAEQTIQSTLSITKVQPLSNQCLIAYVLERKIERMIATRHCEEVYYTIGDKHYFAIGFKNDAGGYELRNKYFKGCTSPKQITTSNTDANTCLLFEGFMDYLSYLTIKKLDEPKINLVVLNSIANLPKAMDFLKTQTKIYSYLDNDEAGKRTTETIRQSCDTVIDQSELYCEFKDLNDFLCNQELKLKLKPTQSIQQTKKKGFRL